jgi:hypothetical protein
VSLEESNSKESRKIVDILSKPPSPNTLPASGPHCPDLQHLGAREKRPQDTLQNERVISLLPIEPVQNLRRVQPKPIGKIGQFASASEAAELLKTKI